MCPSCTFRVNSVGFDQKKVVEEMNIVCGHHVAARRPPFRKVYRSHKRGCGIWRRETVLWLYVVDSLKKSTQENLIQQWLPACVCICLPQYGSTGGDIQEERNDAVYAGPMDPIVEHTAPGMRAIEFRTRAGREPDILTQRGVIGYSHFERCLKETDPQQLVPNLGAMPAAFPPAAHQDTFQLPLQG